MGCLQWLTFPLQFALNCYFRHIWLVISFKIQSWCWGFFLNWHYICFFNFLIGGLLIYNAIGVFLVIPPVSMVFSSSTRQVSVSVMNKQPMGSRGWPTQPSRFVVEVTPLWRSSAHPNQSKCVTFQQIQGLHDLSVSAHTHLSFGACKCPFVAAVGGEACWWLQRLAVGLLWSNRGNAGRRHERTPSVRGLFDG